MWLPVKGYDGAYEISSMARVRSKDRQVHRSDGRKLFNSQTKDGDRILKYIQREPHHEPAVPLTHPVTHKARIRRVRDLYEESFLAEVT